MRSGFFSNRFPKLIEWGLLIIIFGGFFNFGTVQIPGITHIILRVIGTFGFIIGTLIKISAVKVLKANHSSQVLLRRGQQLVEQGPYRFLRHPEYLADILTYAGLAFSLLSYVAFGFTVLIYGPLLAYRARIEERLMVSYWGRAYRNYQRQTVGKLWPLVYKRG